MHRKHFNAIALTIARIISEILNNKKLSKDEINDLIISEFSSELSEFNSSFNKERFKAFIYKNISNNKDYNKCFFKMN